MTQDGELEPRDDRGDDPAAPEAEGAIEPDEVLDPTTRRAVRRLIRQEASYYSGPMPRPEMLRGYNEIVPGAAERIIAMAEIEAENRRHLERRIVNTEARNATLGLTFAFVVAMSVIVGAVYLIATDHGIAGFATLVGGLATLVGAFLYRESRTQSARPGIDSATAELRRIEDRQLPPGENGGGDDEPAA